MMQQPGCCYMANCCCTALSRAYGSTAACYYSMYSTSQFARACASNSLSPNTVVATTVRHTCLRTLLSSLCPRAV